jgi:hypothetical protein
LKRGKLCVYVVKDQNMKQHFIMGKEECKKPLSETLKPGPETGGGVKATAGPPGKRLCPVAAETSTMGKHESWRAEWFNSRSCLQ